MKKYLLFLFSIFVIVAYAQTDIINTRIIQPTTTAGNFSDSYMHHLNSAKDEMFLTTVSKGVSEYFGNSNGVEDRRYISRLDANGFPKWNAIAYNVVGLDIFNTKTDFACVDKDDNFYIICQSNGNEAFFTDAMGTTINFDFNLKILIKISKDGKFLWSKNFRSTKHGVICDNAGNVYLYGNEVTFTNQSVPSMSIIKLNGQNGNEIYNRNNFNVKSNYIVPVFDSSDNLYVFTTADVSTDITVFTMGSQSIRLNKDGLNHLFLKFDTSGNPISGKNYYPEFPEYASSYSYPTDAKFDGNDIIVNAGMITRSLNYFYIGMSGNKIVNKYNRGFCGIISKIDLNGNVKWERDIQSSQDLSLGIQTNIELDEQNSIYSYNLFKEKVNFNNVEYTIGNWPEYKVIMKIDNDGNMKYLKPVDNTGSYYYYPSKTYTNSIDVSGVDKISCMGSTSNNKFLTFPIQNSASPKLYIATFVGENLSTIDKGLSNLEIYPNPTSDILNIQTEQKISKIEILDTSGKLLKSNSGSGKTINVSNLSKGIYLIKIYADKNIINSKFIKN